MPMPKRSLVHRAVESPQIIKVLLPEVWYPFSQSYRGGLNLGSPRLCPKLKHFADKHLFANLLAALNRSVIIENLALQQVLSGIRENTTIGLKNIRILVSPIPPFRPIGIITIVGIINIVIGIRSSKHAGIVGPRPPCRRGASK